MALRSCQPFLIIYKSEIFFLIPSVLDISLVDFIHHNKACFEHTLPPCSSARVSMLPVPFVKVSLQGVWSQCVSLIIFIRVHCWECNLMGKWSFSAHLVTTERVTEKLLRFVHFRLQMWQSRKTGLRARAAGAEDTLASLGLRAGAPWCSEHTGCQRYWKEPPDAGVPWALTAQDLVASSRVLWLCEFPGVFHKIIHRKQWKLFEFESPF